MMLYILVIYILRTFFFFFSEFNFLLDSIVTDLPDELNDPSQNGIANDAQLLNSTSQESASQRHQQLSQILSGAPTPPSSTTSSVTNSGIGMPNSALSYAVKSPLTNNLTSPPHVLQQTKPGMPASSHFLQDNSNYVSSSTMSLPNSSSTLVSSLSNSIQNQNPMLSSMAATSHLNANMSMSHPPNQMMNGPQYSVSSVRPVRGVGMPNAGNAMGPNMGMSQPNLGNHNNPQMTRQGLDHAGLAAASSQAQMMKVRSVTSV